VEVTEAQSDAIPSPSDEILTELSLPLQPDLRDQTAAKNTLRDVLIVLAVTFLLRIPYFHGRMFPLNDGGMFAQIIDDIRATHFVLPTHTTYNFLDIPLSYPPLAFYLGAICTLVTGQDTVTVLTWLPLILNLISMVLVYFIAKEIYPHGFYACLAACCSASIGRSGEWLTMGGGLTRGLGMLWALMAILLFLRAQKQNSIKLAAGSGLFVGLAALSHLEGGIFASLSLVVLSLLLPKRVQNIRLVVLSGAISVIVTLPWMIWLYRHLGFGPLMNAAETGGSYYTTLHFSPLAFLAASIIFAVVGRFPYVCWLAIIPWVMRRSGTTFGAVVGGLCMVWFTNAIVILLARRGNWLRRRQNAALIVLAMALSLQFRGIPWIHSDRLEDLRSNTRAQVSLAELEGMRAVTRLTPTKARFFVFNQRLGGWYADMVAEWFPYFTKRHSVNTVQGREWLPDKAFFHAIDREGSLVMSGPALVPKILDELKPEYLFIAEPFDEDQEAIAKSLRAYARSSPIYKNAEVTIYRVERPTSPNH